MNEIVLRQVAIVGAGAMGSFVGGGFERGGATVTLLDVDAAHIDALNRAGLRITTEAGDHVARPAAMRPSSLPKRPT